jgi:capsular exopolysaccharide synthesis family protein
VSKIYKALARAEAERGSNDSPAPGAKPRSAEVLVPERASRRGAEPHLDVPEHREEYEKLKVMLTLEAARSELKSVMLVSALAGEGVSTVTLGLAAAMAEVARQGVLVVDLNSAKPALAGRLGLRPGVGLGELLVKDATRAEAIVESQIPHLFVLGRGRASADLSQPSSLTLFEELVRGMRSDFDHLIIDGGSLATSPDSLLVASKVDGVILIVQAERTGAETVREASSQLRMAGANLLGVVLNRRREYLPKFIARNL